MEKIKEVKGKSPKKSGKSIIIIVLIVLLAVIILAVAGVYLYFNYFKKQQEQEAAQENFFEELEVSYVEVEPAEAKNLIDTKEDLVVLDVSDKYSEGHLPGAINIEFNELEENLSNLDKAKPILVYCHFKMVSIEAADLLIKNGYEEVYRLKGEYSAWVDADYEVEEGEEKEISDDTDEDGLSDEEEKRLGSDPNKPDTDQDGLTDGQEVTLKTDLNDKDTDGDGYTDGEEVKNGYDPLATPDEVQKKVKVEEEIELEDIIVLGIEGSAVRYMREGKYFLEIEATLPKLKENNYYEAVIKNGKTSEEISAGNLEFAGSVPAAAEGEEKGIFKLKFESDKDYYDYNQIMIDYNTQEKEQTLLKGEFSQERN